MPTSAKQELAKMVRLDDEVHERLTNMGTKKQSYSDIIKRLLDFYDEHKQEKEK